MKESSRITPFGRGRAAVAPILIPMLTFLGIAAGCSSDDDPAAPDAVCIEARIFPVDPGGARLHQPVVFRTTGPMLGEDDYAAVSLRSPSRPDLEPDTTLVFTTPGDAVSFTPREPGRWIYNGKVVYGGHPVGISGGGFVVSDSAVTPCWVNCSLLWERRVLTQFRVEQVVTITMPPGSLIYDRSFISWEGEQKDVRDIVFLDEGVDEDGVMLMTGGFLDLSHLYGRWNAVVGVGLGCADRGFLVILPFEVEPARLR